MRLECRATHLKCTASSFSRHVAYCRRTQHRRLDRRRPKACSACNTAKAKCSFQDPCARCSSKGLSCFYGHAGQSALEASSRACVGLGLISPSSQRPASTEAISSLNVAELFGDQSTLLDGFDDFSNTSLDLPEDDFAAALAIPNISGPIVESSSMSNTLSLPDDVVDLYSLDPSLYDAMNAIQHPEWLNTVPSPEPLGQQAAHHILRALCAVPGQMLRRETFPPFVHPHWHQKTMPESLVVLSLIHI